MSPEFEGVINNLLAKIDSTTPNAKTSEDIMLLANTVDRLYRLDEGYDLVNELLTMIMALQAKVDLMESEYKSADTTIKELIAANNVSINTNKDNITDNSSNISSNTQGINTHIAKVDNPHRVTKAQLGLSNVPNYSATSDVNDASENKFATAKSVNRVWAKAVGTGVPIGTVVSYMGISAPMGWLWVEPVTIYRKNDYPDLYSHLKSQCPHLILSNSTFKLAEGRGVFVRGYDPSNVHDPEGYVRAIGSFQADDFKSHNHLQVGGGFQNGGRTGAYGDGGSHNTATSFTGGDETRGKNINLLLIIKAFN